MSCCTHAGSANRFFSFFARHYHKKYLNKGLEKTQNQLVTGLTQAGFKQSTLLEIGSGVGYLHQQMIKDGATTAVGIDLSDKMLAEAKKLALSQGLDKKTSYLQGDFLDMTSDIENADVTILDKVVCCYPDANSLVHESVKKTNRVYGLTYPRKNLVTKTGEVIMAALMKIFRSEFRPYVHDPLLIEQWITELGFRKFYQNRTLIWLTQVYVKNT